MIAKIANETNEGGSFRCQLFPDNDSWKTDVGEVIVRRLKLQQYRWVILSLDAGV